jgi:hypothetical protein
MCKEAVKWTEKRIDREEYEYASIHRRQLILQAFVANTPQGRGYSAIIPRITDQLYGKYNLDRFHKTLNRFRNRIDDAETLAQINSLETALERFRVPEDFEQGKKTILSDARQKREIAVQLMPHVDRTVVRGGRKYERRFYPILQDATGAYRENVTRWYTVSQSGRKAQVRVETRQRLEELYPEEEEEGGEIE